MKTWLNGKRTYLTVALAMLAATVAWSAGQIDTQAYIAALLGGASTALARKVQNPPPGGA